MDSFLVEIGTEEIPAGYIQPALNAFSSLLTQRLREARIEPASRVYGTARRLDGGSRTGGKKQNP
jgi:glycyl-tRNA synthetase beta chain